MLLLLLVGFIGRATANTEPTFMLPAGDSLRVEHFSGPVQLLEDVDGKLGIRDVSTEPLSPRFAPATPAAANIGFTASAWWVRFTWRNEAASGREVFLRQSYPLIDYVDLYEVLDTGGWRKHETRPAEQVDPRDQPDAQLQAVTGVAFHQPREAVQQPEARARPSGAPGWSRRRSRR